MFNLIEWLYLHQKNNLVYYDSLTKVKSRMYYDRVIKTKYQNKEVMIAFIDVDGLKAINDTEGHQAGSSYLRYIGKQLLGIPGNYEVCRYGGDEFLIVGDFDVQYLKNLSGVSVGVIIKEEYEDLSSAVKKADEQMYRMKARKKL